MLAVENIWAELSYTPKPAWAGCRARPPTNPPWNARSRAEPQQFMFSRVGAGSWCGMAEGNAEQCCGDHSAWGGLPFKPELCGNLSRLQSWLGEPRAGRWAHRPRPGHQSGRWLGNWGPGSLGGPGMPFGPHDCSILV